MSQVRIAVPSKEYQRKRHAVWRLMELPGAVGYAEAKPLQEELEDEFAEAWGFTWFCEEHTEEMTWLARQIVEHAPCRCFDHCTFYFEPETRDHIVVSQPYEDPEEVAEELRKRLILGNGPRPEFIPAPDWSFYYPGYATLVVVKFPDTYRDVLRDLYELSRATASDPVVN